MGYLTDREKEVLNCMVEAWENNDKPLIGDCSYREATEILNNLGLDNTMDAFCANLDRPRQRGQNSGFARIYGFIEE